MNPSLKRREEMEGNREGSGGRMRDLRVTRSPSGRTEAVLEAASIRERLWRMR